MATRTRTIQVLAHGDAPNQTIATVQIDWDDALLRLLAVRCINGTPVAVLAKGTVQKNGRNFSITFPANATTAQNIPQNAAARLDVTVDAQGRVDGVEYVIGFAP